MEIGITENLVNLIFLGAGCQTIFEMRPKFGITLLSAEHEDWFKVQKIRSDPFATFDSGGVCPERDEEVVHLRRVEFKDDPRAFWCGYSKLLNNLYIKILAREA